MQDRQVLQESEGLAYEEGIKELQRQREIWQIQLNSQKEIKTEERENNLEDIAEGWANEKLWLKH